MADERAVSGLPGEGGDARSRPSRQGDSPWREDAHAVVIGIDTYQDPRIPDLRFARSDAEAVYRVLTDPNVGRFNPANVTLLVDADATERKIRSALGTRLPQRASKTSTVCIYFAGHGAPVVELDARRRSADSVEKYLVPHDAVADDLRSSAISMDSIQQYFSWLDANQVICFFDSCYSGAAGGRTFERDSFQIRAFLSDEFLEALASEGRVVITACATSEVALESPEKGHGLFTYHLVRGLQGRADADGDGRVSVDELYNYVYERVARDARLMQGRMNPIRKGTVRGRVYLTEYRRSAGTSGDRAPSVASAPVPVRDNPSPGLPHKIRALSRRQIIAILLPSLVAVSLSVRMWFGSEPRASSAQAQRTPVTATQPAPQRSGPVTFPNGVIIPGRASARTQPSALTPPPDAARPESPSRGTGGNSPVTGRNGATEPRRESPNTAAPPRANGSAFTPGRWNLPDADGLGFVEIAAGPFLMGSDSARDPAALKDEFPQHTVSLPAFLIGRYEVTVGQYLACVDAGACRRPELASANESEWLPVRFVSWKDAITYCDWLEKQLREWAGTPQAIAAALNGARGGREWHVRLPTEAEWERAARGTEGRLYPWGNDAIDATRVNYAASGIDGPSPVGRFPKGVNEYRMFDMSGNVWEWTHSRYIKYPYRASDGREDTRSSKYLYRVTRGGSFQADDGRAAKRNPRSPDDRTNFIGFRVVIGPPL